MKTTYQSNDSPALSSPISKLSAGLWLVALVLWLSTLFIKQEDIKLTILIVAYLTVGYPVLVKTFTNVRKGSFFDENVLILLASAGAFWVGVAGEGSIAMILFVLGEYIQEYSVYRSQKSIADLVSMKPKTATVWTADGTYVCHPKEIMPGDVIVVGAGEKIALDGIIIEGNAFLDNSVLTGESVPQSARKGEEVLSGGIVRDGILKIKVTKPYSDSTIYKLLDMIDRASSHKAKSEKIMTRFASYYTPALIGIAALLISVPPLLFQADFKVWLYRGLVFLAASCPCSLIISIPLTYFAGLHKASQNGVLIKGANYLEALGQVEHLVLDKTGTLTKGNFEITEILPAEAFDSDDVLQMAAFAEKYSKHPIALSIKKAYEKDLPEISADDYQEISGSGIRMNYQGHQYLCGSRKLLEQHPLQVPEVNLPFTTVFVARDDQYVGCLLIADKLKEDSIAAIEGIRKLGVKHFTMLTGDRPEIAEYIGKQTGMDVIRAGMLPNEKLTYLLMLTSQKIAVVGDGINDAAMLKAAPVGIAMGNLGADIAVESADIILSNDNLSSLENAFAISKKTACILKQNIAMTLGFKFVILLLGAVGITGMWGAVFADVGVMLLACLNALRAAR